MSIQFTYSKYSRAIGTCKVGNRGCLNETGRIVRSPKRGLGLGSPYWLSVGNPSNIRKARISEEYGCYRRSHCVTAIKTYMPNSRDATSRRSLQVSSISIEFSRTWKQLCTGETAWGSYMGEVRPSLDKVHRVILARACGTVETSFIRDRSPCL